MKMLKPSAQKVKSDRILKEEPISMYLKLTPTTRKNIKRKAVDSGLTMKAYMLKLLQDDGVEVKE